ncbi:hypothetical protein FH972_025095 [Carpinus fangiana]|uniref:Uncharacterized protein n=1 Tax=Carpinus fangiana TaxID=176857 RepID=A0A5N6L0Y3_9ROSI|nr:hypothetical protein FH972_025095 [Carpinus fangiana]
MTDATTYSSKLAGTRILIVGGSSGIGFAVANAVLELGASGIIIASSTASKIDGAIARLREAYPNKSQHAELLGLPVNLKDQDKLEANIEGLLDFATANKTKLLDHIIYTAGDPLVAGNKLDETTLKAVQEAGMVRFFGPLILGTRAPAYMNPGPKSSITLTTGSVSQKPIAGWTIPASYGTALHGLTRNLALDLKPLRVNLVSPGAVSTELWDGMEKGQRDAFLDHIKATLPTGSVPGPDVVAEAFLLSLRDVNCTGTIINSNGGGLLI